MTVGVRTKKDTMDVYPKFIIKKSKDLMTRGGDFYAVWDDEKKFWSSDEDDVTRLIDKELDEYAKRYKAIDAHIHVCHMWDAETGVIDNWHKYVQRQLRDNFHPLDSKLIFANQEIKKTDYATKKLPYPLEEGEPESWNQLIGILYSPEEQRKIEWSIGCIVSGDSVHVQKFIVLYGQRGTGKSTVLDIIQKLFEGYYSTFDAKSLGSATNQFALEAFKKNPLVAIQHDGDLSHIEDNTRLNSLVSHEKMLVNAKYEKMYENKFSSFLYLGTNRPVKISDAKSGILRRLIDVSPTGRKVEYEDYKTLTKQITFELGKIANKCLSVYLEDPHYYDDYVPVRMMDATNDFYNFINEKAIEFSREEYISAKTAHRWYNEYCELANIPQNYRYSLRIFKEELKNYFKEYKNSVRLDDGTLLRDVYYNFTLDKMTGKIKKETVKIISFLDLKEQESKFDAYCVDIPAQYAKEDGTPSKSWDNVKTTLASIDTHKLHYVNLPENHIVIDFDIKDIDGNKSLSLNIEAAKEFPPTYAEVSKSGEGLHLHYIYSGDVSKLSRIYKPDIEIKVYSGNQSLRRKLTLCNNCDISMIHSGLPLKEEKSMINIDGFKSERALRQMIERNIRKEIIPFTKPSIDLIYKDLESAYSGGLVYDVSDMRNAITAFAASSSHQAEACLSTVGRMKFRSESMEDNVESEEQDIIIFDIESYPNLFLVCYKKYGEGNRIIRMFNPTPSDIDRLLSKRLVGFNNRRYDNHMLYGCLMGYSPRELSLLSQKIINGEKDCFFSSAYNISYTDIYDFCATKQSLKKWEIELGIHHKELDIPWDQPVPKERWEEVAKYCENDVLATEAVWNANQGDFTAREILADLAGMTVNDSTNSLTTRIIFNGLKDTQSVLNYRFMGDLSDDSLYTIPTLDCDWEYTRFDTKGRPLFPGYKFENGVSTYRGFVIGEGGFVYSEPGYYEDVVTYDVAGMHPTSAIQEKLLGQYTDNLEEIVNLRIAIKHKDFEKAKKMFGGALAKYLKDESTAKALSYALKIAVNSVYGLTSAHFDNAFSDKRNIDNIVAKRGALFMVNLLHEVKARGFTVIHIKTDSIKVVKPTPEIAQFIMDYGKLYGYNFEIEDEYKKICLVNKSVYIAQRKDGSWYPKGEQFAVPYLFKNLFSKENITLKDFCQTFSVKSSLYLDMNDNLPDVSGLEKELKKRIKNGETEGIEELKADIAKGHSYRFVGKVGEFVPVQPDIHGGLLMRKDNSNGYAYASDAKGYRWLESETVRTLTNHMDLTDIVDISFFRKQVDAAVDEIAKYVDPQKFIYE